MNILRNSKMARKKNILKVYRVSVCFVRDRVTEVKTPTITKNPDQT